MAKIENKIQYEWASSLMEVIKLRMFEMGIAQSNLAQLLGV